MQHKVHQNNIVPLKGLNTGEEMDSALNTMATIPPPLPEQEKLLKEIWSTYSSHMDRFGETKQTKFLRERYFNVLRIYRKNKNWQKLLKSS